MPVAGRRLSMGEETLRDDKVQTVFCSRHRHVEQSPFFFDLVCRPDAQIGRNAAVDRVEDEDRAPLLALGRMDGGEDQVILIEQRYTGLAGRCIRRVERQLRQKPLA